MPTAKYDDLIHQVQELEHGRQHAERQARSLEHQIEQQRKLAAQRLLQLKTLQTLSLGIFGSLGVEDIYNLTCQTVVHQLLWDTAFIIEVKASRPVILASYQATTKQLGHLHDYLSQSPAFTDAYSQRVSLATFHSSDKTALALRSLFQTDEVVGVPVQLGDQLYAYLVACTHTERSGGRTQEDVDFLAILGTQLAHAIQNSSNFASLEEQNAKLRELDELKDSFISITSHQLRTPLSIIKWILSILQTDDAMKGMDEQLKLIDQAYVSNERLIHVVNDLLNVSRIQEGKLPYTPQLTDLRPLLRDLVVGSEKLAESRKVRLESHFDQEVPAVEIDSLLMKEAIQNLIDNAIDYNEEGGWVRVSLSHNQHEMQITVSNSGPGIDPAEQDKIFVQFYRSPQGVKMQPNGNGLGLYLTKAIANRHGGDVSLDSHPGETTFTISLPIHHTNANDSRS